jgi:hypothetical protein
MGTVGLGGLGDSRRREMVERSWWLVSGTSSSRGFGCGVQPQLATHDVRAITESAGRVLAQTRAHRGVRLAALSVLIAIGMPGGPHLDVIVREPQAVGAVLSAAAGFLDDVQLVRRTLVLIGRLCDAPARRCATACWRAGATLPLACSLATGWGRAMGGIIGRRAHRALMVGVTCRCGACVVLLCSSVLVRAGLVRFLVAASAACHTPAIPAPGTDSSAMPRASAGAVGPALAALFLVIIADGVHSRAIIEASCRLHAMPCHAIPCISCHATPRHAIPSHPMPCKVQDATLHNTRAADHRGEPRLVPAPPAAPLRNDVPD